MPITPFSGVRSSWLMFATKRDFASLACLAWASARYNCFNSLLKYMGSTVSEIRMLMLSTSCCW